MEKCFFEEMGIGVEKIVGLIPFFLCWLLILDAKIDDEGVAWGIIAEKVT